MPIIPALRRLNQEYCEFKVSLWYILKIYLKKQKSEACTVVYSCNPNYLGGGDRRITV
jgi:hypothetical protein